MKASRPTISCTPVILQAISFQLPILFIHLIGELGLYCTRFCIVQSVMCRNNDTQISPPLSEIAENGRLQYGWSLCRVVRFSEFIGKKIVFFKVCCNFLSSKFGIYQCGIFLECSEKVIIRKQWLFTMKLQEINTSLIGKCVVDSLSNVYLWIVVAYRTQLWSFLTIYCVRIVMMCFIILNDTYITLYCIYLII